jgi:hypothetical protein
MKIHPVGTEFFHADGRTDMKKLLVAIRNFAKAPSKACVAAVYRVCSIIGNLYLQTITRPKVNFVVTTDCCNYSPYSLTSSGICFSTRPPVSAL